MTQSGEFQLEYLVLLAQLPLLKSLALSAGGRSRGGRVWMGCVLVGRLWVGWKRRVDRIVRGMGALNKVRMIGLWMM